MSRTKTGHLVDLVAWWNAYGRAARKVNMSVGAWMREILRAHVAATETPAERATREKEIERSNAAHPEGKRKFKC